MKTKFGQILNGDCLEFMGQIPDGSVDMILCDLPYGTTRNKWDSIIPFEALWSHYWRVAKPNAAIVLTAQCPFDKFLGMSQIDFLKYEWIWRKESGSGFLNAKKMPLKDCENVLIFYRNLPTYNPQMRSGFKPYSAKKGDISSNYNKDSKQNIITKSDGDRFPLQLLEFARDREKIHPTQKPVALFEYLIRTYTNEGETVLDNCSGSGTTAIAAINSNRRFICIEREPKYFWQSLTRILDAEK